MANVILKEEFILRDDDDRKVTYRTSVSKDEEPVTTHHYEYFACTCSDENKQYWKQRLNDYLQDFDPEVHADMVSQLVMEINHGYNGDVTIDSDMWFGVSTSCHIWNEDYSAYELVNIFMQCDEVSIGLMAIVDILHKVVQDEQD